MRVCVLGAGPAGLVSLKHALREGYDCDVYERTGCLGGVWAYNEKTDVDRNGASLYSTLYKETMSLYPKEIFSYLDFPYPEQLKSYVNADEVINYFNSYADKFKLKSHIKFFNLIKKMEPIAGSKWNVTIQDLKTKVETLKQYDAVFICNGHFSKPRMAEISGQSSFKGPQWHSQKYKTAEPYKDKRVLIIGSGVSAEDIAFLISKVAQRVFLSHREKLNVDYPTNIVTIKAAVKEFYSDGAVFEDGTAENFDTVLYCTGYSYYFPFLTKDCDIQIEAKWVKSLYKQIINISHSTMYFIGIPYLLCAIPMCDLQVQFALAALGKRFILPSKVDMIKELNEYMTRRREQNIPQKHAHRIGGGKEQEEYFQDLTTTAGLRPTPPVLSKLLDRVLKRRKLHECFKIIDSETFVQVI